MDKLILIISFIIFLTFNLFSEEKLNNTVKETKIEQDAKAISNSNDLNTESDRLEEEKLKERKRKKIFFYFQGYNGKTKANYEIGEFFEGRICLMFRPSENFSIGFGLSNNYLNVSNNDRMATFWTVNYLTSRPSRNNSQSSGSSNNSLMLGILFTQAPSGNHYTYRSFHFDMNYHFNGDSFFDPYMGIGFFKGACFGNIRCSLFGLESRAGVQLNFQNSFVFSHALIQIINVEEFDVSGYETFNNGLSFGAGLKF